MISVSVLGLPQPGPWAMQNGPLAFAAARKAMTAVLDRPLQRVVGQNNRGMKKNNVDADTQVHFKLVVVAA